MSLKYILSCGSLTLIITPQYDDFFTRGLVPNKNYWPVARTDLCQNIKNAVEWGSVHPVEVRWSPSSWFGIIIIRGHHGD